MQKNNYNTYLLCSTITAITFMLLLLLTLFLVLFLLPPNTFSIVDVSTNKGIENASFEVSQNETVITTIRSNSEGILKFPRLTTGNYQLKQTHFTNGYQIDQTVYLVSIQKDGTICINQTPISNFTIRNTKENTSYTITYDSNLRTAIAPPIEQTNSSNYSVLANPFQSDHSFLEWNTSLDGSGNSYLPEEKISISSNLTLYAIWQSNLPSKDTKIDQNILTGTGVPHATIEVLFSNALSFTTIVKNDGHWEIHLPSLESPDLYESITLYQIEPNMSQSKPVTSYPTIQP